MEDPFGAEIPLGRGSVATSRRDPAADGKQSSYLSAPPPTVLSLPFICHCEMALAIVAICKEVRASLPLSTPIPTP